MRFINLRDQPQAIATIAPWHFAEWHALFPHKTLQDFADDLTQSLGGDAIPQTWLMLDEAGAIAGTGSLLMQDMTINQHMSPWLANIYVHPTQRGRGLGKQMVQHVMEQAAQLGVQTLYLFTEDQQAFYEKLGWQLIQRELYEGEMVSVMQWRCQRAAN